MAKLTWRGLAWLLVGVVLVLAATGDAAPIFGADGGGVAAVGADDDDDTVADQLQDALSRLKQLSQGDDGAGDKIKGLGGPQHMLRVVVLRVVAGP